MLKKLVKYGNSTALVLDKALLELLNMGEGAVVKIKTDGTSLIITPQEQVKEATISPTLTYIDAVKDNVFEQVINQYSGLSLERKAMLIEELKMLHAQRNSIAEGLPAYYNFKKAEHVLLKKYYSGSTFSEFQKEYIKLRDELIPEISNLDNQILNFEKTHGLNSAEGTMTPALTAKQTATPDAMQQLQEAYTELFKKHAVARDKMAQSAENPDFIHEMQLVLEKNGGKANTASPEYMRDFYEIRYKYTPEARAMDEEMVEVAKKILCGKPESLKRNSKQK